MVFVSSASQGSRGAAIDEPAAAAEPASAQQLGTIRFDDWLYFQENVNDSERWQYRPRFFIPFDLPCGWAFTQRLDSKTVEFGFGGAYGLVKDDPQYQYIINGRLTFYF